MARIFTDGAEIDTKLWDTSSYCTISNEQKRTGDYSYKLADHAWSSPGVCRKNINNLTEFYYRFAWYGSMGESSTGTYSAYVWWAKNNSVVGLLNRNQTTGVMQYLDAYQPVKLAQGSISIPTTSWVLIEVYFKIGTSGKLQVKIDGVLDIDFSGNTDKNSNGYIDNLVHSTWGTGNVYLDDLALNDTSGTIQNSWCGDGRIIRLKPNSFGGSSDWIANTDPTHVDSQNNYTAVDEAIPDDDTTYVESSNVGDKDLYGIEAASIPEDCMIKNLWIEARAKDVSSSGAEIILKLKPDTIEYDSSAIVLSSSYNRIVSDNFHINPDTNLEWTIEELSNIKIGQEVV